MNSLSRQLSVAALASFFATSGGWSQVTFDLTEVTPQLVKMHRSHDSGLIDSVDVQVGDPVSAGHILVQLDSVRQLHALNVAKERCSNRGPLMIAEGELLEKTAAVDDAGLKYRRRQISAAELSRLEGQMKVAQGKYETARSNEKLAKLEMELAEKMLENRFVRAQIDGTVMTIKCEPGEKVGEAEVVVTVADTNWMNAKIPLTKESAKALANQATIPIAVAGSSIPKIAQVAGISPMPHSTKGEQFLRIVFPNNTPLGQVSRGMFRALLPDGIKIAPVARRPADKPAPVKSAPGRS